MPRDGPRSTERQQAHKARCDSRCGPGSSYRFANSPLRSRLRPNALRQLLHARLAGQSLPLLPRSLHRQGSHSSLQAERWHNTLSAPMHLKQADSCPQVLLQRHGHYKMRQQGDRSSASATHQQNWHRLLALGPATVAFAALRARQCADCALHLGV